MGPLVCLVILQLSAPAAKGCQQVNIQFIEWPEAQAGYVKWCNALVSSVILHRTQQEVENFNNFIFNFLNGLGHKPGMLSDVMHLSGQWFCAELSRR